jgi:RNA polymerase primary sigma factor
MRGAIAVLAAVALVGAVAPAAPARVRVSGHSERLAARARRGDRVARSALVEEHMGLVRSIALRYRDLGLPVEDLVQEGAIGLLTAIDHYDAGRGTSFSTYAFWRVRAAVTHALTAHGQLVRLPRTALERRRRVAQACAGLVSVGHEPSVTELAAETTLPPAEVAEALAPARVVSLDQPSDDGPPFGRLPADDATTQPEAQLVAAEQARELRGALEHLRGRDRTIVTRHFGIDRRPETLAEIAADLQLSPERTRALKDEALRELAVDLAPAVGA